MDSLIFLRGFFPAVAIISAVSVAGWVVSTWLHVKNGYPLDGSWG